MKTLLAVPSLLLTLLLTIPCVGEAQGAWVAAKGTGSISVSYQNNFVNNHLFGKGQNFVILKQTGEQLSTLGELRTHAAFVDFGYSLTDKLAFTVWLPYIQMKYEAKGAPPGFGPHVMADGSIPLDDGKFHGGFQDVGLRLRYNIASRPLMVTPFLQYTAPTNGYPFYSHAVRGQRLAELQIGAYAGRLLDPAIPNTYFNARYAYGIVQRVFGTTKKRHHWEGEVGYFLTESTRVFGIVVGQYTIGGIDLGTVPVDSVPTSANERFFHHVQIQRDTRADVAIGASYSLMNGATFFGVLGHTTTARNVHASKYNLTLGISWGFGGPAERPCHC